MVAELQPHEGSAILDELLLRLGQDRVDAALGVWLARRHKSRARLFWQRPPGPARAPHYLAFVRELDCIVCGHPGPCDPHHHGPRGVGQKTDDFRVVSLHRDCHRRAHDHGTLDDLTLERAIVNTIVRYLRIVEQC